MGIEKVSEKKKLTYEEMPERLINILVDFYLLAKKIGEI